MKTDRAAADDRQDLDSYVERYEEAAFASEPSLEAYLPPEDHPLRREILLELLRVELELSRRRGRPKTARELAATFASAEDFHSVFDVLEAEQSRLDAADGAVCLREPSWPAVGEVVEGYTLLDELGRGAFARVFLARQSDLANRHVAVKISRRRTAEPQRMARLQHENIVPIFSLIEWSGLQLICMPYLGRETLADLLRTQRGRKSVSEDEISTLRAGGSDTKISPPGAPTDKREASTAQSSTQRKLDAPTGIGETAALAFAIDLAAGLAHAHRRGVVHGDVKPANVLIAEDGRAMLLDFHLATDASAGAAATEHYGGTAPYMAPEHLQAASVGASAPDARCDVYSLGVLLYELLAGTRPFANSQNPLDAEAIAARRAGPPRLPRSACRSADMTAIVAKCLAPEPEGRYPTAEQLLDDLRRHDAELAPRYARGGSLSERLAKWRRRHPRLASSGATSAVAALLLVAVATLAWHWRSDRDRRAAQLAWNHAAEQAPHWLAAMSLGGFSPNAQAEAVRQSTELLDAWSWNAVSTAAEPPRGTRLARLPRDAWPDVRDVLLALDFYTASAAVLATAREPNQQARDHESLAARLDRIESLDVGRQYQDAVQFCRVALSQSPATEYSGPPEARKPLPAGEKSDEAAEAAALLFAGRGREALAPLERALAARPSEFLVWMLHGVASCQAARWSEGEQSFTVAVALEPSAPAARFGRGICRLQLQDYVLADADFAAVEDEPEFRDVARLNRALCLLGAERWEESLKMLNALIASSKAPTRVWRLRSQANAALGNRAESRTDMARFLSETPSDAASWEARGYARLRDDPEGAASDFRAALTLQPRSPTALRNLAYVLDQRLNRPDEAIAVLDELIAAAPQDAAAWGGRAVLRARRGDFAHAVSDADQAVAVSGDATTLFQAACAYALAGESAADRLEKCRRLLVQSIALDPSLARLVVDDPDLATLRGEPSFAQWWKAVSED